MQRELHQNGEQHVKVEDIAQRPFPRQFLYRLRTHKTQSISNYDPPRACARKYGEGTHLRPRDTQETNAHEHARDRDLIIPILDPVQVLHAERISRDETVQRQDLVHLDRRDERAAALADDVRDCTTR